MGMEGYCEIGMNAGHFSCHLAADGIKDQNIFIDHHEVS